jgi:hypothetical protein
MHLALATGVFSLTFILTTAGRSMMATAWAWLKGIFSKLAASSPRGILFVICKKSRRGDEFSVLFSIHDAETAARLLQGSPASFVQQFPAALGGDCPRAPHATANPDALPSLMPPQLTAPQLLDSNESQSRSTQSAVPAKKRHARRSRRMGCYRSASRRKI